MAVAFVQANNNLVSAGAASQNIAYSSNNTAGNLLLLVARVTDGALASAPTISSITDTRGNNWIAIQSIVNGNSRDILYAVYACGAGANTVTLTPNKACFFGTIVLEYSGLNTFSPVDVKATNTGNSTAASSGSVTTTANGELVLGWVSNETANSLTITQGASYTTRQTCNGNVSAEDQTLASAGAIAATFTLSSAVAWACGVATFFAAGTGPIPSSGWANRERKFINKR